MGRVHVVRAMRLEDARAVAEVHVRTWQEAYADLMPADYLARMDLEAMTERWHTHLEQPTDHDRRQLVGLGPLGEVVAMGTAGPSRDEEPPTPWELYALNLRASAHGSGLADLMIEELVAGRACSLWVLAGNGRARAFYRRHGFAADGAETTHAPTGAVEVRMVRPVRT